LFLNQRGENIGSFSDQALKSFAVALGLDETAFNECFDAHNYRGAVLADQFDGQQQGVQSTPTIIIDGQVIRGVVPFAELQARIETALQQ
jgi:protein-disulfide isomerase